MTDASSGKRVSQIIKIGDVRPALLERIENGVMSVSGAFKAVTKKDKPKVNVDTKSLTSAGAKEVAKDPKAEVAAASQNSASANLAAEIAIDEALKNQLSVEVPIIEVSEDEESIRIQSACGCCHAKIHILFPKEMLSDTLAAA